VIAYFDTSAFLKLVIVEPGSQTATQAWTAADSVTSSRLLYPEARAGLAAALRGRRIPPPRYPRLKTHLEELWGDVVVLEVTRAVTAAAGDVAEHQGLKGYDAVHLAAALRAQADVLVTGDADLLRSAPGCGLATIDARQ
jgi:predicted nucleic acid-binding protein